MRRFTVVIAVLAGFFVSKNTHAQSLVAGDIAFVSFASDGDDRWAFIALVDIPANEEIIFTDEGWNHASMPPALLADGSDGTAVWVAPAGGVSRGTVVEINETEAVASVGSLTATGVNLGSDGDQLLAYQGTRSSPTFITGMHWDFDSDGPTNDLNWDADEPSINFRGDSALPPGLITGNSTTDGNAIRFDPEIDNAQFDFSVVGGGSPEDLRALLNNRDNWISADADGIISIGDDPLNSPAFPTGTFEVSDAPTTNGTAINAFQNTPFVFELDDMGTNHFPFTDVNGDNFSNVTIAKEPQFGVLFMDIVNVNDQEDPGERLEVDDTALPILIQLGFMKYLTTVETPDDFDFKVSDGVALSTASTITISVTGATNVASIQTVSTNPTNGASNEITWNVTFDDPVTSGLDADNFSLITTGGLTALAPSIKTVTDLGAGTVWEVVAENLGTTEEGTIRLDLTDGSGLNRQIDNAPFTSGEVFEIDRTAPILLSLAYKNNNSVVATFNEGLDNGNATNNDGRFTLEYGMTPSTFNLTGLNLESNTTDVTISFSENINTDVMNNDEIEVTVTSAITDIAGNALAAPFTASFNMDTDPPLITNFEYVDDNIDRTLRVTFSEEVFFTDETDFNALAISGAGANTTQTLFSAVRQPSGNEVILTSDGDLKNIAGIITGDVIKVTPLTTLTDAFSNPPGTPMTGDDEIIFDLTGPTFTLSFVDDTHLRVSFGENIANGVADAITTASTYTLDIDDAPALSGTYGDGSITVLSATLEVSGEDVLLEVPDLKSATLNPTLEDMDRIRLRITTSDIQDLFDNNLQNTEATLDYDESGPSVIALEYIDDTHVLVRFDQEIEESGAENVGNYTLLGSTSGPIAIETLGATLNNMNNREVTLEIAASEVGLATQLTNGESLIVAVSRVNVVDLFDNPVTSQNTATFIFDTTDPQVVSLEYVDPNNVLVTFNEPINPASLVIDMRITLEYGTGPTALNISTMGLSLDPNGTDLTITVDEDLNTTVATGETVDVTFTNAVTDLFGNGIEIPNNTAQFTFDATAPDVSDFTFVDDTHLRISFNDMVSGSGLELAATYTLTFDGGTPLTVNSATLEASGTDVLLETPDLKMVVGLDDTDVIDLVVTTSAVTDLFGNQLNSNTDNLTFDKAAPTVNAVLTVTSPTVATLEVTFNEPVVQALAEDITNYTINSAITPSMASLSMNTVTLTADLSSLGNPGSLTVLVENVTDLFNNLVDPSMDEATAAFADGIAPQLVDLTYVDDITLKVSFSEDMNSATTLVAANYDITTTGGGTFNPSSVAFSTNNREVLLNISGGLGLSNGDLVTVTGDDATIDDVAGNTLDAGAKSDNFTFDNVEPQVSALEYVDNHTLRVRFNEALNVLSAETNDARWDLEYDPTPTDFTISSTTFDVNEILYQASNGSIRYTFNSTPDLSGIEVGDVIGITTAGSASNNGFFTIVTVNDASDYLEVDNPGRSDNTDDESADSPALAIKSAIELQANGTDVLITVDEDINALVPDMEDIRVTVTNAITDIFGNGIAAANLTATITFDAVAPQVSSLTKVDDTHLLVTFSEPVFGNLTDPSQYTINSGALPVSSAMLTGADQVTLEVASLATNLNDGEIVTVVVTTTGIIDGFGNELATTPNNEASFVFDEVNPVVASFDFLTNTTVKVTFSEKVLATGAEDINNYSLVGSINGVVTIAAGGASLDVVGEQEVTLTIDGTGLTDNLDDGEILTVTVNQANITDLAGNPVGTPNSSSFVFDENPPVVTNLEYVDDNTDQTLLVTFSEAVIFNNASDFDPLDIAITTPMGTSNLGITTAVAGASPNEIILTTVSDLKAVTNIATNDVITVKPIAANIRDSFGNTLGTPNPSDDELIFDIDGPNITLVYVDPTHLKVTFGEKIANGVAGAITNPLTYDLDIDDAPALDGNFLDGDITVTTATLEANGEEVILEVPDLTSAVLNPNLDTNDEIRLSITSTDIQDLFDNDLNTATSVITFDETGPQLNGDITFDSNTQLRITFDEALESSSATTASNYIFSSSPNNEVTGSPGTATQSMANEITFTGIDLTGTSDNEEILVTVSNVTDLAGNVVDPTANQATFNYDAAGPSLLTGVVTDAAPADIVVTFTENASGTFTNGFTIRVGNMFPPTAAATISSVSGSGTNQITFTLDTDVQQGEFVTIEYLEASGDIVDEVGNPLLDISQTAITNNIFGPPSSLSANCLLEGINLTWNNPPGTRGISWDGVLVVGKQTDPVSYDPTGTSVDALTGNPSFGTPGTNLGSDNFLLANLIDESTSLDVTNLTPGETYHFAIFSYRENGDPDILSSISMDVQASGAPTFITDFAAIGGDLQVDLSWNALGDDACVSQMIIIASEIDFDLAGNITAVNLESASVGSGAYTPQSDWNLRDPNANDVHNITGTTVGIDDRNFVVYRGAASTGSANVSFPSNGTQYYFRAFLFDDITSDISEGVTSTATPLGAPNPPSNFQIDCATENEINISWTKPAGNFMEAWHGVVVYGNTSPTLTQNFVGEDGPLTTDDANGEFGLGSTTGVENGSIVAVIRSDVDGDVTISNIQNSGSYYFQAYAFRDPGGTGDDQFSSGTAVESVINPGQISGITATAGNGSVTLNWTNPVDAASCIGSVLVVAAPNAVDADISQANLNLENIDYTASANYDTHGNLDLTSLMLGVKADNRVVFNGSGETATVNNLTNGVTYQFKVFLIGDGSTPTFSPGQVISSQPNFGSTTVSTTATGISSVSSLTNTNPGTTAFEFTVTDDGALMSGDDLPTLITDITITENTVTALSGLDVESILYQVADGAIRYTFAAATDLSSIAVGEVIRFSNSINPLNDGGFTISAVNDASDYVEVMNPNRSDNSADQAAASPALGSRGADNPITDWSDAVLGATLEDGMSTPIAGSIGAGTISFNSLNNANPGDFGHIADDGAKTYTLKLWIDPTLSNPLTIDNQQFNFEILSTNILVDASGSALGDGLSNTPPVQIINSDAIAGSVTVDVTASKLEFSSQPPAAINTDVAFAGGTTLSALNANDFVDRDYGTNGIGSDYTITNSGSIPTSGAPSPFVNGQLDFTGYTYNTFGGDGTITVSDISGLGASPVTSSTVTVNDVTKPTFSKQDIDLPSEQGFRLTFALNENNVEVFYMVSTTAITPTQTDIRNNNGGFQAGSFTYSVGTIGDDQVETIVGLDPDDTYFVYLFGEDSDDNESDVVLSNPNSIDTGTDNNDPGITAVILPANTFSTSFQLDISLDEIGTAYYVVQPDATNAPTGLETSFGLNGDGLTPIAAGTISITEPNTVFSETVDFLAQNTAYDVYVSAADDSGNGPVDPPAQRDVTTNPASTGGINISTTVDDEIAPSLNNLCVGDDYVTLSNIRIEERADDAFGVGAGQTLILTLSSGFEFEPGIGSVDRDPTSNTNLAPGLTLNVEANRLTITYTVTGTNQDDALVISGLRVRSTIAASGTLQRLGTEALGGTANITGNQPGSGRPHASFLSSASPTAPEPLNATGTAGLCQGDAINLYSQTQIDNLLTPTATTINQATHRWYSDAALTTLIHTGIITDLAADLMEIGFATTSATTYTMYVTDVGGSGCESPASRVDIEVRPTPTANAGIDQTICRGDQILLGNIPSAINGSGSYSYSWTEGGLTIQKVDETAMLLSGFSIGQFDPGTITGVESNATATILSSDIPSATILIDGASLTGTFIEGETVRDALGNLSTFVSLANIDFNVSESGSANVLFRPAIQLTSIDNDLVHDYQLVVNDANGCQSDPSQVRITVRGEELINFNLVPNQTTFNDEFTNSVSVTATPNTDGSMDTYTASFNLSTGASGLVVNDIDAGTSTFTPQDAGLGTHILTYDITNNNTGCSNSDEITFNVNDSNVQPITGLFDKYCEENVTYNGIIANTGDIQTQIDAAIGPVTLQLLGPGISTTTETFTLNYISNTQLQIVFSEPVSFGGMGDDFQVIDKDLILVSNGSVTPVSTTVYNLTVNLSSIVVGDTYTVNLTNINLYPNGLSVSVLHNPAGTTNFVFPLYTFNPANAYAEAQIADNSLVDGQQFSLSITRRLIAGNTSESNLSTLVSPLPELSINNFNSQYCVTDPSINLDDDADNVDISLSNDLSTITLSTASGNFIRYQLFQDTNSDGSYETDRGVSADGEVDFATIGAGEYRLVYTSDINDDILFNGSEDPVGCSNSTFVDFTIFAEPTIPSLVNTANFVDVDGSLVYEFCEGDNIPNLVVSGAGASIKYNWKVDGTNPEAPFLEEEVNGEDIIVTSFIAKGDQIRALELFGSTSPGQGVYNFDLTQTANRDPNPLDFTNFIGCESQELNIRFIINPVPDAPIVTNAPFEETDLADIPPGFDRYYIFEFCADEFDPTNIPASETTFGTIDLDVTGLDVSTEFRWFDNSPTPVVLQSNLASSGADKINAATLGLSTALFAPNTYRFQVARRDFNDANFNGCTSGLTLIDVIIYPEPVQVNQDDPEFGRNFFLCTGESLQNIITPSASQVLYNWYDDDLAAPGGVGTAPNFSSSITTDTDLLRGSVITESDLVNNATNAFDPNTPGTYYYWVTQTTNNDGETGATGSGFLGCESDPTRVTVTVYADDQEPQITGVDDSTNPLSLIPTDNDVDPEFEVYQYFFCQGEITPGYQFTASSLNTDNNGILFNWYRSATGNPTDFGSQIFPADATGTVATASDLSLVGTITGGAASISNFFLVTQTTNFTDAQTPQITHSGASGLFAVGSIVTGTNSTASGKVESDDGTILEISNVIGTFIPGEPIGNGTETSTVSDYKPAIAFDGCESLAASIEIVVYDIPEEPGVVNLTSTDGSGSTVIEDFDSEFYYCFGDVVANISVIGESNRPLTGDGIFTDEEFYWYSSLPAVGNPAARLTINDINDMTGARGDLALADTELGLNAATTAGTYTFYVTQAQDIDRSASISPDFEGCEGPARQITVNIIETPSLPEITVPSAVCSVDPIPTVTVQGAQPGDIFRWYDKTTTELMGFDVLNTTTYVPRAQTFADFGPNWTPVAADVPNVTNNFVVYRINSDDIDGKNFPGCTSGGVPFDIVIFDEPTPPSVGTNVGSNGTYEFCENDNVSSSTFSVVSPQNTVIYTWYAGGIASAPTDPIKSDLGSDGGGSITFNQVAASTMLDIGTMSNATIFVTQTTDGLCESEGQAVDIFVNPLPIISFTNIDNDADNVVCVDATPKVLTPNVGGATGTGVWRIDGVILGDGLTDNGGGTVLFNPLAAVGSPATYLAPNEMTVTVSYTFTDDSNTNCVNTTSQTVTITGLPDVSIQLNTTPDTGLNEYCIDGGTISLQGFPIPTGSETGVFSNPSMNNSPISNNPGGAATINLNDAFTVGVGMGNQRTYTVEYTFTDEFNCQNSITQDIIINDLPIFTFEVQANDVNAEIMGQTWDAEFCRDDIRTISFISTEPTLTVGDFTASGTGFFIDSNNSSVFTKVGQGDYDFDPDQAINQAISQNPSLDNPNIAFIEFTIDFLFTNNKNCTNTSSIGDMNQKKVRIYRTPQPVLSIDNDGPLNSNEYCRIDDLVTFSVNINFNDTDAEGGFGGTGVFREQNTGIVLTNAVLNNAAANSVATSDDLARTAIFNPREAYDFALAQGLIANDQQVATFDIVYEYTTRDSQGGNFCTSVSSPLQLIVNPFIDFDFSYTQGGSSVDDEFCVDEGTFILVSNSGEGNLATFSVPGFSTTSITDLSDGTAIVDIEQLFRDAVAADAGLTLASTEVMVDIQLERTDAKTCTSTHTQTITIHNLPVPEFDIQRGGSLLLNDAMIAWDAEFCIDDRSTSSAPTGDRILLTNTTNAATQGALMSASFSELNFGLPASVLENFANGQAYFYPGAAMNFVAGPGSLFENETFIDFEFDMTYTNANGCTGSTSSTDVVAGVQDIDNTLIIRVYRLAEPIISIDNDGPLNSNEYCPITDLVTFSVDMINFNSSFGGTGIFREQNTGIVLTSAVLNNAVENSNPASTDAQRTAVFDPFEAYEFAISQNLISDRNQPVTFNIVYDYTTQDSQGTGFCNNVSAPITLTVNPLPDFDFVFTQSGPAMTEFCVETGSIDLNASIAGTMAVSDDITASSYTVVEALSGMDGITNNNDGTASLDLQTLFDSFIGAGDPKTPEIDLTIRLTLTDGKTCETFIDKPLKIINRPFPVFDVTRGLTGTTLPVQAAGPNFDAATDHEICIDDVSTEVGGDVNTEVIVMQIPGGLPSGQSAVYNETTYILGSNAFRDNLDGTAYFYPEEAVRQATNQVPALILSPFVDFEFDLTITSAAGCVGKASQSGDPDGLGNRLSEVHRIRVYRLPVPILSVDYNGANNDNHYCIDDVTPINIMVDNIGFDIVDDPMNPYPGTGVFSISPAVANAALFQDPASNINASFDPKVALTDATTAGITTGFDPFDFEITYTYTTVEGCANTSSIITFTVNPLPTIDLDVLSTPSFSTNEFCIDANGGVVDLNADAFFGVDLATGRTAVRDNSRFYSNFEDPIAGTSPGILTTGPGRAQFNLAAAFDLGGAERREHEIVYEFTDIEGCVNRDTTVIIINKKPVASFDGIGGCNQEPVTFTARIDDIAPGDVITQYEWDFDWDGIEANFSADTVINQTNPQFGPLVSTIYNTFGEFTVGLRVSSEKACNSSVVGATAVIGEIPSTNFTYSGLSVEEAFQFSASPEEVAFGSIDTIRIDYNDGVVFERFRASADPADVLQAEDFLFEHTFSTPGVYQVVFTFITNNNCSRSHSRLVPVLPKIPVTSSQSYEQTFDNATVVQETINGSVENLWIDGWVPEVRDIDDKSSPLYLQERDSVNTWDWGTPAGTNIQLANTGGRAIVTNITGSFLPEERSWIYTPVFDLTALRRPMIRFERIVNFGSARDGVALEYSTDNGLTWTLLGGIDNTSGAQFAETGINWYDRTSIQGNPGNDNDLQIGWGQTEETGWLEARHKLDEIPIAQRGSVIFRFFLGAASTEGGDGFGIDNFYIEERDRLVLLEQFSGRVDGSIGLANNALTTIIDDPEINNNDGVVITYQTDLNNTATELDPINRSNPADPNSRVFFYGVDDVPASVLNGVTEVSGGFNRETEDSILPWDVNDFNQESLKDNELELDLMINQSSDDVVSITVGMSSSSPIEFGDDIRLYIAVVEKSIESGGVTLRNVLRTFLPNGSGTTIVADGNAIESINQTWPITSVENPDNLAVVAFVQDNRDKRILQADVQDVGDKNDNVVTGIEDLELNEKVIRLYPNPANWILNVSFDETLNEDLDWVVYNQIGAKVVMGEARSGDDGFTIDTSYLPDGMYFLLLTGEEMQLEQKKFIVRH